MRAASCSRPAGPRSTRSTASRRRWRSSSACRAAGARARWRRPPRSGTSCACCTSSSACSTACTTARRCGRRAPRASPRSCCATTRGQHVGLLAPLVVARKGVYTDLAKWAKARGHTHLRVDGEFLQARPVAAARPLQGAHARAAGRRPGRSTPEQRGRAARRCSPRRWTLGKGVMHLLRAARRPGGAMVAGSADARRIGAVKVFSTKRACPICGTSYPELDPRMFTYNSKHGWCTTCVGTGLALTREQRKAYDDSMRDDDDKGREQSFPSEEAEVEGVVDEPCPDCAGTRLNPASRAVTLRRPGRSAEVAQLVGGRRAHLGRGAARWHVGRDAEHRARRRQRDHEPARVPGGGGPRLPDARPRRADAVAAARRSASAWRRSSAATCRACATCSTSRPSACTRATTASCSTRCRTLGDKGNTLVVVEHDEDTIRRADHIIDIGPGAGKRGGPLVAEGSGGRPVGAARAR